jgi:hypothetical protein
MRKDFARTISQDSRRWGTAEAQKGAPQSREGTSHSPQASGEWLPESTLRDALIAERLPTTLSRKNLFWINIRRYLNHRDAQLPPEEYLRHWREIYRSCLNRDTARLSGLSYVSVEGPVEGDVN